MNNERRKLLSRISEQLEILSADIETLRDEEQECYDNLPEGLQQSERGESMETAVCALEEAINNIESATQSIEEAVA